MAAADAAAEAAATSNTPGTDPPTTKQAVTPHAKGGRRPDRYHGNFVFTDVHFAYPTEKQKPVLNGLSFTVQPGQKVALVGKAGCGKSTAITLVQRFYDCTGGLVTLDGHPIAEYDLHHLRAQTGVVAQENVLFSASIRENITYGMGMNGLPVATEAMVTAACKAANCAEFIADFPNGLATLVGEKGIKLSGGQKQRVAIARAIIRAPPILLLDEATSALDSVNEKEVQRALDHMLRLHKGVALVIAHRLTTIKNCDQIVVIDKGVKVEQGTHTELLQVPVTHAEPKKTAGEQLAARVNPDNKGPVNGGYYHNMWDTQMGEDTKNFELASASSAEVSDRVEVLSRELKQMEHELGRWNRRKTELATAAAAK